MSRVEQSQLSQTNAEAEQNTSKKLDRYQVCARFVTPGLPRLRTRLSRSTKTAYSIPVVDMEKPASGNKCMCVTDETAISTKSVRVRVPYVSCSERSIRLWRPSTRDKCTSGTRASSQRERGWRAAARLT